MDLAIGALSHALRVVVASGPEKKDVASAMLGASAALGGLTLVFLGIVVAGYQSYDADTMASVRQPYRHAALRLLITFGASLLSIALSTAWLITATGEGLYILSIVIFGVQLALIALMAPLTVYKALLD